jgi:DNA-binding response OmpR family regulator
MDQDVKFSGNILVADDEKVNVDFFEVMLTKLGFDVETAYSGEEVFEKLKSFIPDLIILDLLMPKMSGFEVAKRLKADSKTREIPIIILTAVSDIRDKVDMLELGIEDYIMKPFNFIEILARIRNVLKVGAIREELKACEKKLQFLNDFQKSLHLFLENTQNITRDIVASGERVLSRKDSDSGGEGSGNTSSFIRNVVETGKKQLERIEDMKCTYRALVEALQEGERGNAQGE